MQHSRSRRHIIRIADIEAKKIVSVKIKIRNETNNAKTER